MRTQRAGTKLIYILAHDSKEAAGWLPFEVPSVPIPTGQGAKTESEKDGSLTIEPGSAA